MIHKLVLPALAAVLLGGCVTGDYAHRSGERGDYYYGRPTTEYRDVGPYGGYAPYGYGGYSPYGYGGYSPYGYGGFGYGAYGYPRGYYGYPYGYGGNYNHPYYRPYYRRPPVTYPRPDGSTAPQHRPNDRRPPWRNFDEMRRRQSADGGAVQPRSVEPASPEAAPHERGSRMEQTIRRANQNGEQRAAEQEP